MKNYIRTITFTLIWALIVPLCGFCANSLTDTLPPHYDPIDKTILLQPPHYVRLANTIVGYRRKIVDLSRISEIRDSIELTRVRQLYLADTRRSIQDSLIRSLESKVSRYEEITASYKSLISKRDSIYTLTEKRFIKQIEHEKRTPTGFWPKIKDKIIYLAIGVIVGIVIR